VLIRVDPAAGGRERVAAFDLRRMFLGDESPLFLAEVAFRTAFLFSFTILLLRLVGKRGVGQFSLFEIAIIIALGSAVGDPMFYPDVPLAHGMVVIAVIVVLYRGLMRLMRRSERFERFVEGEPVCLVDGGRVAVARLGRERLTTEELFEILRQAGVTQLGEVKVAYLEQSGRLSTFAFPPGEVRPGLPIVPPWDIEPPARLEARRDEADGRPYACCGCGGVSRPTAGERLQPCPHCGETGWTPAVREPLGGRVRPAPGPD
jgi:uncharacterized membrane protein YcaP (DUF421 family)